MPNLITGTGTAEHFARRLAFEIDCADAHGALSQGAADFVLLEARGPAPMCPARRTCRPGDMAGWLAEGFPVAMGTEPGSLAGIKGK